MIVCVCHSLNDKKIRSLIQSGIHTVSGLQNCSKAGTDCGACLKILDQLIHSENEDSHPQGLCQGLAEAK